MITRLAAVTARLLLALMLPSGSSEAGEHGLAMHGDLALPPGFTHLHYVNPQAPKGGRLRLGVQGSFDSLNVFIPRGNWAEGIREHVYESLLARNLDEPFSLYGLIAESVATPPDRSSVTFKLRAEALFSDGTPITADDVLTSFALLKEKGVPFYRSYFGRVEHAERLGPREVRFAFADKGNRELPLIMGFMPILPRHRMSADAIDRTSLEPPIGSGPYVVARVEAGRLLVLKRNPDYWGRALAIQRGRNNFDEIRYDYFASLSALLESFKIGALDLRIEDQASRWASDYKFPAVLDGRVLKAEIETRSPAGMNALVLNTRRSVLADPRVRRALVLALDFEWINRNLYHGLYRQSLSYFARSDLAALGVPAEPEELRLLAPYASAVTQAALDGRGPDLKPMSERERESAILALVTAAGYRLKDGRLMHATRGTPLSFEVMIHTRAHERLLTAFASRLQRLGIEMRIRLVDDSQFWNRAKTFDFDVLPFHYSASLSPGNEQLNRWTSTAADIEGSLNFAGVKSPAVDAMIKALLEAETRASFRAVARSLDRVLISGDYVVPLYHAPRIWIAHWRHLKRPSRGPLQGLALDTWWSEADKP